MARWRVDVWISEHPVQCHVAVHEEGQCPPGDYDAVWHRAGTKEEASEWELMAKHWADLHNAALEAPTTDTEADWLANAAQRRLGAFRQWEKGVPICPARAPDQSERPPWWSIACRAKDMAAWTRCIACPMRHKRP